MGTLSLLTSLSEGAAAWVSQVNSNLDQLNARLSPLGFSTATNLEQLPVGTPTFCANATDGTLGGVIPLNPFPVTAAIRAGSTSAFLGLLFDIGGRETGAGSFFTNIVPRDRYQSYGYMRLRHTETPGTPMYAKTTLPYGITTSPTNAIRIGTFMGNNQVLIWPIEL